jgi:hypothetical protein
MNGGSVEAMPSQQIQVPTISERLQKEEIALVQRLDKIRELRAGMEKNPEIATVIDGLSALGHVGY